MRPSRLRITPPFSGQECARQAVNSQRPSLITMLPLLLGIAPIGYGLLVTVRYVVTDPGRVPFIVWLSPALRSAFGIDDQCLRNEARQRHASHDQLFHSLLGIFSVRTSAYDRKLDLFGPCRR